METEHSVTGRSSGTAVAVTSVIASSLWVYGAGSVVGLVLGLVVLRRGGSGSAARKLAVVGVVLAGVGIVIPVISRCVSVVQYHLLDSSLG